MSVGTLQTYGSLAENTPPSHKALIDQCLMGATPL